MGHTDGFSFPFENIFSLCFIEKYLSSKIFFLCGTMLFCTNAWVFLLFELRLRTKNGTIHHICITFSSKCKQTTPNKKTQNYFYDKVHTQIIQELKVLSVQSNWEEIVSSSRRKIRLIEDNAKCRHLKNWSVQGLCGRCLSVWGPEPYPPPLHTVYVRVNGILFTQGSGGRGGGESGRATGESSVHKALLEIRKKSPDYKLW